MMHIRVTMGFLTVIDKQLDFCEILGKVGDKVGFSCPIKVGDINFDKTFTLPNKEIPKVSRWRLTRCRDIGANVYAGYLQCEIGCSKPGRRPVNLLQCRVSPIRYLLEQRGKDGSMVELGRWRRSFMY